jgi:hypothetical protein
MLLFRLGFRQRYKPMLLFTLMSRLYCRGASLQTYGTVSLKEGKYANLTPTLCLCVNVCVCICFLLCIEANVGLFVRVVCCSSLAGFYWQSAKMHEWVSWRERKGLR